MRNDATEITPLWPDPSGGAHAWDDPEALNRFTRWLRGSAGERRAESLFSIEGMDCGACSLEIERVLDGVDGVESADVNALTGHAVVRWDPARTRASVIAQAIRAAGYRPYPALSLEAEAARAQQRRLALWRLFVAGFCMMQVMMYAVPVYLADPGTMSDDITRLLQWASWVLSIPVVVFSAGPFLAGAWNDLWRRRIGMDVPVALGIVVTFVASTGAAFDPGGVFGSETYFDSLTMFVFFLLGGRYLAMRARDASVAALERLALRVPETALRVLDNGVAESVPVGRLRAGDRVRVRPGQSFPADGLVVDGETQVDESLLTGESQPVQRNAGDEVVAGSFNLSSPVEMRVERAADDSRRARLLALTERSATERPAMLELADRVAAPFLTVVLLGALGAGLAWSLVDPQRSVWIAVSVLIVTCPCALSLAAPSALFAAAGSLARQGVLVRRLGALESLAKAELVVFDKTGTLTEDRLVLARIEPVSRLRSDELMGHAAALAQASLHPLATALAGTWPARAAMDDLREVAGRGIEGRDACGRRWRLGSPGFVAPGEASSPIEQTTAWLSVDGSVVARFLFDEAPRADARAVVAKLQVDGVGVALLSGDNQAAARRIGDALGIRDVQGGASPEQKLAYVTRAQERGTIVAMVGDGVNDAPVAARADVSFAIGQRAPIVCASADFTSLGARLNDVVTTRRLAQRTVRIIRQNLVWAALYNAACVPLAMMGALPPWLAGLGMAASSLVVVLNSSRVGRAAKAPAMANAAELQPA